MGVARAVHESSVVCCITGVRFDERDSDPVWTAPDPAPLSDKRPDPCGCTATATRIADGVTHGVGERAPPAGRTRQAAAPAPSGDRASRSTLPGRSDDAALCRGSRALCRVQVGPRARLRDGTGCRRRRRTEYRADARHLRGCVYTQHARVRTPASRQRDAPGARQDRTRSGWRVCAERNVDTGCRRRTARTRSSAVAVRGRHRVRPYGCSRRGLRTQTVHRTPQRCVRRDLGVRRRHTATLLRGTHTDIAARRGTSPRPTVAETTCTSRDARGRTSAASPCALTAQTTTTSSR